jgi:DNA repair photolyase
MFLKRDEALQWGHFVRPKTNISKVLAKELESKTAGVVGISTITDPYQPLEAKLQITRRCLELLSETNFFVSIQTKSALILRDMDIIEPKRFEIGVSISTLDPEKALWTEPKASAPQARAQVVEEFSKRGIKTWIFLGPMMPGINDDPEDITQIVMLAKRTGAYIIYDKLNLKKWVRESIKPFFDEYRPDAYPQLDKLLRGGSEYWRSKSSLIEEICSRNGVICEAAFPDSRITIVPFPDKHQSPQK